VNLQARRRHGPSVARVVPRALHPGAWWLWALGLATAASRTTDPVLLLLVLAVAGYVVSARRTSAPWARSFGLFLRLGMVVITIRVVAQVVLGTPLPGTVLFVLPSAELPAWAAGVRLGGEVTDASVVAASTDGLRLATMLACVGAANALANPKRLLASLPAALYELGVAVVIALSFAPSLVTSVSRIRAARRLRGRPDRGLRSIVGVAMPVLEDALERSLALAAAMDSRGYGRRADVAPAARRVTAGLLLTGLLGVCVGVYGLLDGSAPATGLPALAVGVVLAAVGLRRAGRRTVRSRYRPDPIAGPERATMAAGLAAAAAAVVVGVTDPSALQQPVTPLDWPPVHPLAVAGILVALLPAWATPPPTLGPAPTASPATTTPTSTRPAVGDPASTGARP
jgi:energy-coupling factor transport system permease protein